MYTASIGVSKHKNYNIGNNNNNNDGVGLSDVVLIIDTILMVIFMICLSCICCLAIGTLLGYFGNQCSKQEKFVKMNSDDDNLL